MCFIDENQSCAVKLLKPFQRDIISCLFSLLFFLTNSSNVLFDFIELFYSRNHRNYSIEIESALTAKKNYCLNACAFHSIQSHYDMLMWVCMPLNSPLKINKQQLTGMNNSISLLKESKINTVLLWRVFQKNKEKKTNIPNCTWIESMRGRVLTNKKINKVNKSTRNDSHFKLSQQYKCSINKSLFYLSLSQ